MNNTGDNRNMIYFLIASMVLLFGYQYFVMGPQQKKQQAAAQAAARAVLAKDGLTNPGNTVTVNGNQVDVTVTTTTNTVMLAIVGINTLTVHATAAAQAVDGVTTLESP